MEVLKYAGKTLNLPDRIAQQIWPKLKRADDLLSELAKAIGRFRQNAPPYRLGRRLRGHERVYFIEHLEPIPVELAVIAGDVLHNLRGVLDHLVYQLACVQIGEPAEPYKWAAFPIGEDEARYKTRRDDCVGHKKVGRLNDSAIAAIDGLKPYKGGNTLLWQLSELNNVDKHRLVLTPAAALTSADVGQWIPEPVLGLRTMPAEPICPLQVGSELITCPDHPGIVIEVQFDVGIHEPGIVTSDSLLRTLVDLRDSVCDAAEVLGPFLA
jgi:hypothetical protein